MKIIEAKGRTYIDMNGKDFQVLRMYCDMGYGEINSIYFAQLVGKYTLKKEDLPDKKYVLMRTLACGVRVYTIYRKDFFNFDTQAQRAKWLFAAPTYFGAWYLALKHLVRFHNLVHLIDLDMINARAKEFSEAERLDSSLLGWDAVLVCNDEADGERAVLLRYDEVEARCLRGKVLDAFEIEDDAENNEDDENEEECDAAASF